MMVFVVRPYGAPLPLPLPLPLWPIRSPPGNTLRSLRDWRSADLTDVVQKIKSRSVDRALGFLHQMVTNPTHLIFSYISPTLTVTSVRMTNKVLDLFTVSIGLCILRLIWIWLASWEILVTGQIIHWTVSSHNTQRLQNQT